ncbi:hypothetical protein GLOTRDRAFT_122431 [Gloeophyllum trabeum ATCC 11539]|uniref:Uncharacterized protein n=1 Tax=Gloeophyllum trabeum (strain ATCC 11539 / FP-39264 / Madison 617) TaxID=670483 RepID=S7RKI5_GLOTA|nr:uncharacterized protein GLOTRDRAFT_122431 [Gloeophyllum trabeum ATCC 11539]EPQ53179.1 hypothetical protein GLOTRDRAFT_122431 [Gloeophyllum trabeum ATCC 11539]
MVWSKNVVTCPGHNCIPISTPLPAQKVAVEVKTFRGEEAGDANSDSGLWVPMLRSAECCIRRLGYKFEGYSTRVISVGDDEARRSRSSDATSNGCRTSGIRGATDTGDNMNRGLILVRLCQRTQAGPSPPHTHRLSSFRYPHVLHDLVPLRHPMIRKLDVQALGARGALPKKNLDTAGRALSSTYILAGTRTRGQCRRKPPITGTTLEPAPHFLPPLTSTFLRSIPGGRTIAESRIRAGPGMQCTHPDPRRRAKSYHRGAGVRGPA